MKFKKKSEECKESSDPRYLAKGFFYPLDDLLVLLFLREIKESALNSARYVDFWDTKLYTRILWKMKNFTSANEHIGLGMGPGNKMGNIRNNRYKI